MKDLKALSHTIIDALGALPADASADTRASAIEQLIGAHVQSTVKAISNVGEYGSFLRDVGFAKAAAKKLAPAFKSIAVDDERQGAALTGLLTAVRAVADTLKPTQE